MPIQPNNIGTVSFCDVSGLQMRPDHWAPGEPSGTDDRGCVILSTDVSTGRAAWKAHNCSAALPFLCQFGMYAMNDRLVTRSPAVAEGPRDRAVS